MLMMCWVGNIENISKLQLVNYLESNKKVFYIPGGGIVQDWMATSSDPSYAEIGKNRFIVPESWDQFYQMLEQVFSSNDLILLDLADEVDFSFGVWYRSDESPV